MSAPFLLVDWRNIDAGAGGLRSVGSLGRIGLAA